MPVSSSFSVASYNVLANAYAHPAWYPRTPAMALQPAWRMPALLQHTSSLAADVLCLQEVEKDTFAALRTRLGLLGYGGHYGSKQASRPDGCAMFYRREIFEILEARVLAYADGDRTAADSGYVAQIALLRHTGRVLGIANTHLLWDPPATPQHDRRGDRQIRQLLTEHRNIESAADGWIICGDLNVTPESEVVAALERAGFQYAHRGLEETYTCNVNGPAKLIDYLFHSNALQAEPQHVPRISDRTPLPSAEQPSDHLPIVSRFYWSG